MISLYNPKEYKQMFGVVTPKKIGSGSFGKVFETSKDFAVKVQPRMTMFTFLRHLFLSTLIILILCLLRGTILMGMIFT